MKKVLILAGIVLALTVVACNKEKSCRCSVIDQQTVRIINITSGSCDKLSGAGNYDALDTLHRDEIICTDFAFDADTTIVER